MATGTVDSAGQVSQVARDTNMDMATATMIKKYKRTLTNFQEDFLIPFVCKAAWRFMQFDPQRYPSTDVKFIPTATLGIIAREYEQKQMAFLIQTLGADSPLTPILMQGVVKNSSLSNREEMLEQMVKAGQPDPQEQQLAQQDVETQRAMAEADIRNKQADTVKTMAETQKITTETELAPKLAEAKLVAALSTNLTNGNEEADFNNRVKIADLALREKDIDNKHDIARMQLESSRVKEKDQGVSQAEADYLSNI